MALRKQAKLNLSDTNIAGLGSEIEKEVRLNAAKTEQAWKDVGKEVGLRVWRIEKFHIVEVPKDSLGSFYTGDSYIILNVILSDLDV
jgi:gelsolin